MYSFNDHRVRLNKNDIYSTQFDEITDYEYAHLLITAEGIRFFNESDFENYLERLERTNMFELIDLHRKIYSSLFVIHEKEGLIHFLVEEFKKKYGENADILDAEFEFSNCGDNILITVI